jgi:hypothetical protein
MNARDWWWEMANTVPGTFSVRLLDAFGTVSAARQFALLDPTASINDVITAYTAWRTTLGNLTDSGQTAWRVSFDPSLSTDAFASSPYPTARNEQTGLFSFVTPSGRRSTSVIPGLTEDAMVNGKINLSYGNVATFLARAVLTGQPVVYASGHNELLTALHSTAVSYRKLRKQLQRSSFERP